MSKIAIKPEKCLKIFKISFKEFSKINVIISNSVLTVFIRK